MKFIDIGPRRSGKTTRALALLSHAASQYKNIVIVAPNFYMSKIYSNSIIENRQIDDDARPTVYVVSRDKYLIPSMDYSKTLFVFDEVSLSETNTPGLEAEVVSNILCTQGISNYLYVSFCHIFWDFRIEDYKPVFFQTYYTNFQDKYQAISAAKVSLLKIAEDLKSKLLTVEKELNSL